MMVNFICLVGLPASGKSTLAKTLAPIYNAEILSSDDLRLELLGNTEDQSKNALVFDELIKRTKTCLSNKQNVIFDATNLSYKRRMALVNQIKSVEYSHNLSILKECIIMATPFNECLKRNAFRERKVSHIAMKSMIRSFTMPQYFEGWDTIEFIRDKDSLNSVISIDDLLDSLRNISQDNPHHSLTIGDHCIKCAKELVKLSNSDNLAMAALLHDIGKYYVKEFIDSKGCNSINAHFYGHEFVSTYEAMNHLLFEEYEDEDILEICLYIQFHMRAYDLKNNKSSEKLKNLIGQTRYENLLLLHQADQAAH